mmetsp:Transcript_26704/g.67295  ORF Transcript_26704/g.67295 Transcript_26704/m.67295 type:complete len:338 (+) Transcript_26704:1183-2196(+)
MPPGAPFKNVFTSENETMVWKNPKGKLMSTSPRSLRDRSPKDVVDSYTVNETVMSDFLFASARFHVSAENLMSIPLSIWMPSMSMAASRTSFWLSYNKTENRLISGVVCGTIVRIENEYWAAGSVALSFNRTWLLPPGSHCTVPGMAICFKAGPSQSTSKASGTSTKISPPPSSVMEDLKPNVISDSTPGTAEYNTVVSAICWMGYPMGSSPQATTDPDCSSSPITNQAVGTGVFLGGTISKSMLTSLCRPSGRHLQIAVFLPAIGGPWWHSSTSRLDVSRLLPAVKLKFIGATIFKRFGVAASGFILMRVVSLASGGLPAGAVAPTPILPTRWKPP